MDAAAKRLIEMANNAGGHDNITIILAEFEGEGLEPASDGTPAVYQQYPLPVADDEPGLASLEREATVKSGGRKPGADVKRVSGGPSPPATRTSSDPAIDELPTPQAMWRKFLDFNHLTHQTIVAECQNLHIPVCWRDEATPVAALAEEIAWRVPDGGMVLTETEWLGGNLLYLRPEWRGGGKHGEEGTGEEEA